MRKIAFHLCDLVSNGPKVNQTKQYTEIIRNPITSIRDKSNRQKKIPYTFNLPNWESIGARGRKKYEQNDTHFSHTDFVVVSDVEISILSSVHGLEGGIVIYSGERISRTKES